MHNGVFILLYWLEQVLKGVKTEEGEQRLCKCVYHLNKLDLRTASGATLLHLAVNGDTPVEDARARPIIK